MLIQFDILVVYLVKGTRRVLRGYFPVKTDSSPELAKFTHAQNSGLLTEMCLRPRPTAMHFARSPKSFVLWSFVLRRSKLLLAVDF